MIKKLANKIFWVGLGGCAPVDPPVVALKDTSRFAAVTWSKQYWHRRHGRFVVFTRSDCCLIIGDCWSLWSVKFMRRRILVSSANVCSDLFNQWIPSTGAASQTPRRSVHGKYRRSHRLAYSGATVVCTVYSLQQRTRSMLWIIWIECECSFPEILLQMRIEFNRRHIIYSACSFE